MYTLGTIGRVFIYLSRANLDPFGFFTTRKYIRYKIGSLDYRLEFDNAFELVSTPNISTFTSGGGVNSCEFEITVIQVEVLDQLCEQM